MSTKRNDQQARRDYWAKLMEEAYGFVEQILVFPVKECCEPMVLLTELVADANVEVTFSDRPHADGYDRMFYLREGISGSFIDTARDFNSRGWIMHVEDAFRSIPMQRGLARQDYTFDKVVERVKWELDGPDPSPDLIARRLAALIAPSPKVGTHMSGSAIDVSVLSRESGEQIDRGGPYLEMSELTPMASPFVSDQAQRNRAEITAIFEKHGFVAYPYEFWHYSKGDAYDLYMNGKPGPAVYGAVNLDPATGRVSPIESPADLLNSADEIAEMITARSRKS